MLRARHDRRHHVRWVAREGPRVVACDSLQRLEAASEYKFNQEI